MLKKTLTISFIALCMSTPAMAIDPPKDASPTFTRPATAYASQNFNKILEAYQLRIDTGNAENLPSSYARIQEGNASFNSTAIAYSPKQYHAILSAYGLQLTVNDAKEILKTSSYATVTGDTISFGNSAVAYGGQHWNNIMSAYNLPAMAQASAVTPPPTQPVAMAKPGDDDGDGVINDKDACPDTPRNAAVDDRGCWALANSLLFDFDSAVINKKDVTALDQVVKVFKSQPDLKVTVEGHADSTGPEAYNQTLSEKRAQAVAKWLVDNAGVMSNKLNVVGYGEMKPAYPNDTPDGRAKNRRVEFTPAK
jgi:outer membrane protein OmpA-like peptidoglycan-associated protein